MALTNTAQGDNLVSVLNIKGTSYTLKDAWARAEIDAIESAIGGGVHFRGVSTTAIADGDSVKDLTVNGNTYAADKQVNGDIFIYQKNGKNLEFIVSGGKYSELGSTGSLGALAFADTATGTGTVNVAGAITLNDYTPLVGKGTLAVTTTAATLGITTVADSAAGKFTPAAITVAEKGCSITTTATAASAEAKFTPADTVVAEKACSVTTTATAVSSSGTFSPASITFTAQACNVTTTATTVESTGTFSPAAITVAASSVTITPTTGTFSALEDVTYDGNSATLTITSVTSAAFWTGVSSAEAAGQVVTPDANQSISVSGSYDKVTAVTSPEQTISQPSGQSITVSGTYDKVTAVSSAEQTITYAEKTVTVAVTYDKVTAVTAPEQTISQDEQDIAVTYVKATGVTGSALATASLTGDVAVTAAAPTATITNPTVTITVTPDART